jgi:small subunit ribosomal protein S16
MLRIRLSRVGAKKQPSYRIVVADVEAKRDGRVVERIGYYNPRTEPLEYRIDEDRALYWLSVGAQPSDAVRRLLAKQGTLDRLERLRAGESLEALTAEFLGVEIEEEPEEPVVAEPLESSVEEALAADEEE